MMSKIKINSIAAATLALAMWACSSTDDDFAHSPEKYITFAPPTLSFEAQVSPISRANLVESLNQFTVHGFLKAKTVSGAADNASATKDWDDKAIFFTGAPDVFNGTNFNGTTVTVGDGYTTYGTTYKRWSDNGVGSYSFIAHYAAGGTWSLAPGSISSGSEHGPRLTFTLPNFSGTVPVSQIPDALLATKFDHEESDGLIALNFNHILTGLRFKFHNHTNKELVVRRITVTGDYYKSITFDFTTINPVITVPTTAGNSFTATYEMFNGSQTIAGGSADLVGTFTNGSLDPATLLFIANPKADFKDIMAVGMRAAVIEYTLGGAEKTASMDDFSFNYLPKPNTLHTAHFNFVGDDFYVYFQADNNTNWDNGSDVDHTIK